MHAASGLTMVALGIAVAIGHLTGDKYVLGARHLRWARSLMGTVQCLRRTCPPQFFG